MIKIGGIRKFLTQFNGVSDLWITFQCLAVVLSYMLTSCTVSNSKCTLSFWLLLFLFGLYKMH